MIMLNNVRTVISLTTRVLKTAKFSIHIHFLKLIPERSAIYAIKRPILKLIFIGFLMLLSHFIVQI